MEVKNSSIPDAKKFFLREEIERLKSKLDFLENNLDKSSHNTTGKETIGMENRQNLFAELLPTLVIISIITMVIMTIYEVIKQELHPEISVWESHMITIVFSGIVAPVAAYLFLRRLEILRRKNREEIDSRKKAEIKLQQHRNILEELVSERTALLKGTNKRLLSEIEEHKKTINARLQSEQNFSQLFKFSAVILFKYDKTYRITAYNRKFIEFVNSTPEEIEKLQLNQLVDNRLQQALSAPFSGEEGSYEGEYHTTLSGQDTFISLKTAPSIGDTGEISGGIGMMENISFRKKYETALIHAKEHAEKSDKLKSEFLASMSHEIRTPINTILSFTSLIREEVSEMVDSDTRIAFSHIDKAGMRIIRTMDMILNMSELTANTYEKTSSRIDLIQLIENIYQKYLPEIESKNLDFNILFNCNECFITSDEYSLIQIFENLVDNAVKYTESGGITVQVQKLVGNYIIEITDTGIGISENYKAKLFQAFSQEEQGYTRKYEGNGLGLALTKRFADINNIEIAVFSQKGKGSTFRLSIPY